MKSLYKFLLLFALSVCQLTFAQKESNSQANSFKDDSSLAYIDSVIMAGHAASFSLFDSINDHKNTEFEEPTDSIYDLRIRRLDAQSPIDLVYNPYVKQYIKVYTARRKTQMSRMMGLAELYFPMFEEVLDSYNLPLELKYLAIVESALNPRAKSWAGATGLWQFMFNTGKEYDLKVSSYVDERMDPYRATVAACQFFEQSYKIYNDWSLVLASYNCGRGNVNKAIRRSGGQKNYWRIRRFLPGETRNYVPAFIAVCYAMNYAEKHGIKPAKPRMSLFETDTVQVKYQIDFEYLSQSIGITEDELEFLNPSYKINVIPKLEHRNYSLRLPKDKIGVFVQNETDIYAHFSKLDEQKKKSYPNYSEQNERVVHRVKPGEYLGRIAIRYGCSVKKIQQWNNLKSDRIKVGQKLVLYVRPDYI